MSKYLFPLKVFIGGHVALLIAFLVFPAMDTAGTQLAADTANASASVGGFWGWTWVVSSIRLIVFLVFELLILFGTARAFLVVHREEY